MKTGKDAFGQALLSKCKNFDETVYEVVERDDGFIDCDEIGQYFEDYKKWSRLNKLAVKKTSGRVLDVGCGAGRHILYLQDRGLSVVGVDSSEGAVEVSKLRGAKDVRNIKLEKVDSLCPEVFDTVLMMGNNFGLMGSQRRARAILKKLYKVTSSGAKIIAECVDPYTTLQQVHLDYHRDNKKKGRLPGQLRLRVRHKNIASAWFDYLFVSPDEMNKILEDTDWEIQELVGTEEGSFLAVMAKKF